MPAWLTPPTALTIFRMLLTPWIGWEIAHDNFVLALPLLFIAGISDAFDGWLARKFNWFSDLGAKLDPLADKFLVTTAYIALGFSGGLPVWLVALVLSRDFLILLFAAWAMRKTVVHSFPPSNLGKLSTAAQLLLAGAVVLERAWPPSPFGFLILPLVYVVAALTVMSGVQYARNGRKFLAAAGESAR